ncbi:MAG: AarF/ABC1/UbiB kinase family protein [Gemmatimonadales bacterium]|nr:MAG: AarF/ABC1/UbiB kinase family protein [Gemmatimonadales bacterium]
MRRMVRGVVILVRFLPYLVAFLRDRKRFFLLGSPARRKPGHHDRRADRLAATIALLGPTFIKLAQIFSARADLFPEPYLSAIGTLQDQVPPVPTEGVREVIVRELGQPLEDVFDDFEDEPMAAASLGQVHRAGWQGRKVVVKVLRPGVEEMVALDLALSFRILFWLNVLFPNHHTEGITNVVREFSVRVREEMDFRSEAANIERFERMARKMPGVRVPHVHRDVTTRRVLVMERMEGTKVDRLQDRFASGELDFDEIMGRLTGLYLRMMLMDGFLHADPHPGNLLVSPEGDLVILDWGMALEVPRWTRDTILSIALATERDDLDGMINGMYRLGMISPEVPRGDVREAAIEVMRIMERARTSSRERVQEIVQEVWDTFYTWPLLLPQELVYFFRAAVLLEGIGFRYDPDFNGLFLIRRVVAEHRRELLKETAREPVTMAKDVLTEAVQSLRSVRDLLGRLEREEFRVRVHPRDARSQERFLHLQARRLLLSVFATATALISAILYIAIGNVWLLAAGLLAALVMFLLTLIVPTHLLEYPLRHARGLRPGMGGGPGGGMGGGTGGGMGGGRASGADSGSRAGAPEDRGPSAS